MSVRLFVGGLAFTTSTDGLRDAFARFGPVQSAAVMTDRETGRSRGCGFGQRAGGGGGGGNRFGGGGGGGWQPPMPEGRSGPGRGRGERRGPGGPPGSDYNKGPRKGPKKGAPGEDRGGRGRRGSDGD